MRIFFVSIFFLLVSVVTFNSCTEEEIAPAAAFTTSGFVPGFKWKLNAGESNSPGGGALQYRWDYQGDQSEFDTPWLSTPQLISLCVPGAFSYSYGFVTLQVKDANGHVTTFSDLVYENGLMNMRIDSIKDVNFTIYYNRYRYYVKNYMLNWSTHNFYLPSSNSIYNAADSTETGSYIDWYGADTLRQNPFYLPSKTEWELLGERFLGSDIAGFNLQVQNNYSLRLKLNGMIQSGELKEEGETGYDWTSTEIDSDHAWAAVVSNQTDSLQFVSLPKTYQCKVRLSYLYDFSIK